MIIKEKFYIDGREFNRIYSSSGRYVVRDGVSYIEACDPAEFGREYEEGELIPEEAGTAEEVLNVLLGGAE